MLGSLTFYRRLLHETFYLDLAPNSSLPATIPTTPSAIHASSIPPTLETPTQSSHKKLPPIGHGLAGILAGWTVSFIAAPVEHIKARLQVQYSASKAARTYTGPVDCCRKIVRTPNPCPALPVHFPVKD